MASATVRVEGLRELNRAFARGPLVLKREYGRAQRSIAEPIRQAAESRAFAEIGNMSRSPQWGRMRTGLTTRVIYVAPKQRRRGGRPRKNLAPLLLNQALIPALEQNETETVRRFDRMLATVGRDWER